MSKIKFTGKSEDDAVRKAADKLGTSKDKLQYDVVSRTGGLLGLLGQSVTIEVTVGERRAEPPAPPVRKEPAPEPTPVQQEKKAGPPPLPPKPPKPRKEKPPMPPVAAAETEEPTQAAALSEPTEHKPEHKESSEKRERSPRKPRDNRHRDDRKSNSAPKTGSGPKRQEDGDDDVEAQVVDEAVFAQKQEQARTMLTEILGIMETEATIKADRKEAEIVLTISGKLPDWVGKGHTRVMESLQFLVNKSVNRFAPRYRVVLQVQGAQQDQRQNDMEEVALSLGKLVTETQQSLWVLPMSAKERRFVHMALKEVPGLETSSLGSGTTRRLRIAPSGD